jgi:penicillin amidase
VDLAFVIALQNDVKSRRAERLCPALVEHLGGSSNAEVELVRAILSAWDFRYALDSVAPTIFETFMDVWQERVILEYFPERLSELLRAQTGVASRLIEHCDLEWFKRDIHSELVDAAVNTMQLVHAHFGSDQAVWQWGVVHRAHWRHPLSEADRRDFDIGPRPVDGGNETVRNTGVGQPGFSAVGGAEYRIVVDFAEPHAFLAVQNIGNSGQPGHPHYADQFADWLAGRYHTVSLRRADVERDLESSLSLERSDTSVVTR